MQFAIWPSSDYKWGFVTDIEDERVPNGLNEDIIRADFGQEARAGVHARVAAEGLSALGSLEKRKPSRSGRTSITRPIDYQDIVYYSAPKQKPS